MSDKEKKGLELMREPFPEHQISKLPKPTKAQTDAVKADFKAGIRCKVCGGWHHPDVVHLDYVGHAALTDRLLDCDPNWTWEPVAFDDAGKPAFDSIGGLWIKLTVCGLTRFGYGHPDGKTGGNAIKEAIGDALRNAAMRFGAALDLWHKGDLHTEDSAEEDTKKSGIGIEMGADDVTPEQYLKGTLNRLEEWASQPRSTAEKLAEMDIKKRADPAFKKLNDEQKLQYDEAVKLAEQTLKQKG